MYFFPEDERFIFGAPAHSIPQDILHKIKPKLPQSWRPDLLDLHKPKD